MDLLRRAAGVMARLTKTSASAGAGLAGSGRSPAWRRAARGYLLLPHLMPIVVVEVATLGFAVVAWGGWPPPRLLLPLVLGMLGGQLAIGATNELADLPFDAIAKPDKPLPRGDVSVRGARWMVIGGLGLMTVSGLTLGLTAFALLALGTGIGVAYDLWLKRTVWSWLPYLLALPLLPIWVFVALERPEPRLLLLYPLGALATAGVHFAQALPDVETDRVTGQANTTSRLGSAWTFVFAWLAACSAPLLALLAAEWLGTAPPFPAMLLAALLTVLCCVVNVIVLAVNRTAGAAVCFPLVALSTLASGLAWTLAVAR